MKMETSGPHPVPLSQYLVLDDRIIDEVIAAELTLGTITKHPQNPFFGEDKPWEPRFDNVYANVIYDVEDTLYKCWYNPFIIDERVTHTPPEKRHPDWCNYDEIRIYYGAGDGYFFNWRNGYLALATLRSDGWAGYEPIATDMPAVITTQPLTFDGASVGITADVSGDGSVRVAILDGAGNQLASSQSIHSTVTDFRVKWEPSQNLANLRGKEIRLRFQLHNAKLYAFQTGTERA